MKHLIAAACLLLATCAGSTAPSRPMAISGQKSGQIVTTGSVPRTERLWDYVAASQAVTVDPPRHPTHPARNRQLVIPSGPVRPELGRPAEMNALFFLAAGPHRKPTMLLLHGLPGNERNLDLAQAVRRSGWNVLTFSYRGAWGSEGTFSLQHAFADIQAAMAFLRSPEAIRTYGIDIDRLVIAGHSMGGFAAADQAASEWKLVPRPNGGTSLEGLGDPPLAGVILLDAWNIAATARQVKAAGAEGRAGFIERMDDVGHALGPITAADLADNLIRRGEEWDLKALAPKLSAVPLLTVYATHGGAEDNRAMAAALRQAGARVTAVELDSDHAFADSRIRLAVETVAWLQASGFLHPQRE
jgi:pimeloyl-ACP methyl ester carboxylesterase